MDQCQTLLLFFLIDHHNLNCHWQFITRMLNCPIVFILLMPYSRSCVINHRIIMMAFFHCEPKVASNCYTVVKTPEMPRRHQEINPSTCHEPGEKSQNIWEDLSEGLHHIREHRQTGLFLFCFWITNEAHCLCFQQCDLVSRISFPCAELLFLIILKQIYNTPSSLQDFITTSV